MIELQTFIFRPVAKLVFLLLNVFAVFVLLRGHDMPGGGFIAGLASGASVILMVLATDVDETVKYLWMDPVRLCVLGMLLLGISAVLPLFYGLFVLEHFMWEIPVPFLGSVVVPTPLVFDFGVYLLVIGVTIKLTVLLVKSSLGRRVFTPDEERRYSSTDEVPVEEVESNGANQAMKAGD